MPNTTPAAHDAAAPHHPVFPWLRATGGLEGCCATALSMDDSRREQAADVFFLDCAGCIDAPAALPTANRRRPYVQREGATR